MYYNVWLIYSNSLQDVILCRREIRQFVNDGYCVNDGFGINYPKGLFGDYLSTVRKDS